MDKITNNKDNDDNLDILLLKVRSKYPSLTNAAKKVADYILNNYNNAVYLNIIQLAAETNVSESTITKFVRTLGYNAFHDLKISLARASSREKKDENLYGEISLDDDVENICTNVFFHNIEALKDSLKILDFNCINQAADFILKARKVDLYGMGSSTIATLNAKMRFYRLGILCFNYNDPHQQIISASLLKKTDVAIGISNSGRSDDVVKALSLAKQSGASTICITNYDDTPIVKSADIKLFTSTRDFEQLNESLNARIAELSLLDALYVCVASKMEKQTLHNNIYKTSEAIKANRQ